MSRPLVSDPTATALIDRLRHQVGGDAIGSLGQMLDWVHQAGFERVRFDRLVQALEDDPAAAQILGERLCHWLCRAHLYPAFVSLGLFSRRGFPTEFAARLYERLNPAPLDRQRLRDVLALLFHHGRHSDWISQIDDDRWLRLLHSLSRQVPASLRQQARQHLRDEALYALEMLAIWVAAEEMEPDLLRLDPILSESDSHFVSLQRAVARLVRQLPAGGASDFPQVQQLLSQCRQQLDQFRQRTVLKGTSLALGHLLERLEQTLERMAQLLALLQPDNPDERGAPAALLPLLRSLVRASAERYSLARLWQRNLRLLARSVTESSSDHGEHYICHNRLEYLGMLASAAGAGILIALMALAKIQLCKLGLPPLAQTLLVSLNYACGFVLIHLLHGTVATKQPAMTAARIAKHIEQGETGRANVARLADLLIEVHRSQFAAVLGNLGVALLVALLLGGAWSWYGSTPLLDTEAVAYQLKQLRPFTGLALFHAAIAGVWLFLSGLIAGFFDNRAAYVDLRARLRHHPLLTRLLQPHRRQQLADYLHDNSGALASHFGFGLLLGITPLVGQLAGLPLDIRHIAFSAANLGYVAGSAELSLPVLLQAFANVLLIGGVNLWLSFALALWVALRARETRLSRLQPLYHQLREQVRHQPQDLFLPPAQPCACCSPTATAEPDKACGRQKK